MSEIIASGLTASTHEHSVVDTDVLFTVDAFTRIISTEKEQKTIIMQGDHNSEKFSFEIPRYIEGHDMYLCNSVQVHFLNIETNKRGENQFVTGVYTVDDFQLKDEETLTCSWLISKNATVYAGNLSFMLSLSCLTGINVDYRWITGTYSDIYVTDSLNANLAFESQYVDVIEQWKATVKSELLNYIDNKIDDRATTMQAQLTTDINSQFSAIEDTLDETLAANKAELNNEVSEIRQYTADNINTFNDILGKELTDMDDAIDVLEARMDTFTSLPEGATAGDAELADIRVGADGKTYESAGKAVREQIEDVNNIMSQYESMKGITWSYGYLGSNGLVIDHTDGSTSDRMKTDFIPCGENIDVDYFAETNHESIAAIAFYDKSKNIILAVSNIGEPINRTIVSPAGTAYVRISSRVSYLSKSYVRFGYNVYANKIESALNIATDNKIKIDSLNGIEVNIPLRFYIGALSETGKIFNSLARATTTPFYVSGSYKAAVSNENYLIYVYNRSDDGGEEATTGAWTSEVTFTRTGNISIYVKKVSDDTNMTVEDMVAIASSITLTRLADSAVVHFDDLETFVGRRNAEVFVSPDDGSDENPGTFDSPFETVQHAIDSGYRNICLMPGVYKQSIYAEDVNNLSIYAYNGNTYPLIDNPVKRSRPVFSNGTLYDETTSNEDGYVLFTLNEIPIRYNQVFIDKTLTPEKESTRPSYNAGLWVSHGDKYKDYKLKPVLTYEELSEEGTFYFDGSDVYVNPGSDTDIIGYTVVGDLDSDILHFVRCNNLHLNGVTVQYAFNINYRLYFCNHVTVDHCEAGYSMFSDNFSCNYSDIVFNDCLSYKARNDGFNTHFYGVSIFNNCRGIYNYDDGESSHEYCKVIVNGGEYAHNYKAGHAPVNGCEFEAHNCYCHDNTYGFYLIADEGYDLSDALVKIGSSVSINNSNADIINAIYNTVLFNTKYGTTKISSGTLTDLTE